MSAISDHDFIVLFEVLPSPFIMDLWFRCWAQAFFTPHSNQGKVKRLSSSLSCSLFVVVVVVVGGIIRFEMDTGLLLALVFFGALVG